jgi:hypothetical protein
LTTGYTAMGRLVAGLHIHKCYFGKWNVLPYLKLALKQFNSIPYYTNNLTYCHYQHCIFWSAVRNSFTGFIPYIG